MSKVQPASASISAGIEPDKGQRSYSLGINGRGTSVLGKPQGDHVTAYGLIENGFYRALTNISPDEIEGLFSLGNRNNFRQRRDRVYDFIGALAALDPGKRDDLYEKMNTILVNYNNKRAKKTKLREETKDIKNLPDIKDATLKSVLEGIEAKYKENGTHLRHAITGMIRLVLTFYNHIPYTAYFAIEGFEASHDEGASIKTARDNIETAIRNTSVLTVGGQRDDNKRAYYFNHVITAMVDLLHYPEITDEDLLGAHWKKTLKDGAITTAKPRDNDHGKLAKILAKHVHVVFAVYPELNKVFDKNKIIEEFIQGMINSNRGWPSLQSDKSIADITAQVKTGLAALEKKTQQNPYIKNKSYVDIVSSDDEEETTRPVRSFVAKVKKEETVPQKDALSQSERDELEQLRRMKAIIDNNIALPHAVKLQLQQQCPALYPPASNMQKK